MFVTTSLSTRGRLLWMVTLSPSSSFDCCVSNITECFKVILYDLLLKFFCFCLTVEEDEFAEDMKKLGFPRQHRHKLACLRQEVVDAFVE